MLKMPDDNPKTIFGSKKPDLTLVPPAAKVYMALAMQNGADKYGPYNWRLKRVSAMTYLAAAMRHIESFIDGEECASDSGVPHLAHAMASLGILVDALETGNLNDNRPPSGVAGVLIDRWTKPDHLVGATATVERDGKKVPIRARTTKPKKVK